MKLYLQQQWSGTGSTITMVLELDLQQEWFGNQIWNNSDSRTVSTRTMILEMDPQKFLNWTCSNNSSRIGSTVTIAQNCVYYTVGVHSKQWLGAGLN